MVILFCIIVICVISKQIKTKAIKCYHKTNSWDIGKLEVSIRQIQLKQLCHNKFK